MQIIVFKAGPEARASGKRHVYGRPSKLCSKANNRTCAILRRLLRAPRLDQVLVITRSPSAIITRHQDNKLPDLHDILDLGVHAPQSTSVVIKRAFVSPQPLATESKYETRQPQFASTACDKVDALKVLFCQWPLVQQVILGRQSLSKQFIKEK
jgi:hypothetical protein